MSRRSFDISLLESMLTVEASSATPLYRQLYGGMRTLILNGRLAPGIQLPPTRVFSEKLGISRNTIKIAFEMLQAEGYFLAKIGSGTYVADIKNESLKWVQQRKTPASGHRLVLAARARAFSIVDRHGEAAAPRAFQPGLPAVDLFPHDIWARIIRRNARSPNLSTFGYAFQNSVPELKQALATYLGAARGVKAKPEQILITPSAQAALDLVVRVLLEPEDVAWIEDPSYVRARAALIGSGAKVVPVPVDEYGMNLGRADRSKPKLIYVTPSHQCPTGITMSLSRRLQLLEFAEKNNSLIVEDDYDSEIRYQGQPIMSLQGLAASDLVIYIGTFAKTMMPGIRAGYLVAPPNLVELFESAQRYMGHLYPATLQAALADFIGEGFYAAHIRRMLGIYRERREKLLRAIERKTGGYFQINPPPGGLQLSAVLPDHIDDTALSIRLKEMGVASLPLSRNYMKNPVKGLILGFAAPAHAEIDRGVDVIVRALNEFQTRSNKDSPHEAKK